MRKIGVVASGSSETEALVILTENEERRVKIEDLVEIWNKCGNKVLAVCRKGMGIDENLRVTGAFKPTIAYIRKGLAPSDAKRHFCFKVSVIADITNGFEQNKLIIAPGSEVHAFEEKDNPMEYLKRNVNWDDEVPTIGHYKDVENWRVPVDPQFIQQHIGVFGVTGCGKSFLTKYEIIPLLRKCGYNVIVFDWKGYDYATHPSFTDKVVRLGDMYLDDDTIVEFLASRMEYFRYSGSYKRESKPYYVLTDIIHEKPWRDHLNGIEDFRKAMEEFCSEVLSEMLECGEIRSQDKERYRKQFVRALKRIRETDLKIISGILRPKDILNLVKRLGVCVIDLSGGEKETKLSVFLSLARHIRELIERGKEELNLALIIDEAPQYCPFNPRGVESETTDMIKDLCAIGRAYKLCIVLISQGMAGEIGINAAVRRNLNTLFIGRIHPLDIEEAKNLLGSQGVDIDFLTKLPTGHFYFLGCMNPSPIPLLISFKPPMEETKID